jgi:hypothetical protein
MLRTKEDVERQMPSHDAILRDWYDGEKYRGPGKKAPQRCAKCHRINYESRWQSLILGLKTMLVPHACVEICSSLATCPTKWKKGILQTFYHQN